MATAALVGLAVILPASSQASYTDCGQPTVDVNTTKILKVQKMTCSGGKKIAAVFEDRNAYDVGDTERIKRFVCKRENYYYPFRLAYKCRHTLQRGKALKAFWPPERISKDQLARRDKSCGSFALAGLMTPIKVKITKGDFPCRVANRVMRRLYKGGDIGNWECVGPQTGYAKCSKPNRGSVVARF